MVASLCFYKVKEGMFKKLLHDPRQFVSQFACAGQKAKEDLIFHSSGFAIYFS